MADESDGLVVLEGYQTQVPKSSLFEATVDAESAIPAKPLVLKPVAHTEHSIGGSTDEEETLEDEFDPDEYQNHVTDRSNRTCCSRRSIIWLAFNAVALAAVSGALLGVLLKSTGVFRPTSTVQSGGGSMTNAPTMSPVINYAPPPTESPPPSESPLPTDPLYKILESFSLGGIDDPSSPQYQAYEWLSKEDHIIDADSSNMDRIQQRYALVTLYVALGIGEIPDASRGECDWPTLECRTMYTTDFFDTVDILSERTKEQQVTEINLAKKSLKGTIPAEISLLAPSLERLDLSENPGLQGSIPDELYDLTQLKFLYLNENSMTGTLSENIGNLQLLEELFLGSNGFTGTIPFNLGSHQGIRPLRYMILYDNQFSGPIPLGLNLQNMFYMDLSHNALNGTLPADIGSNFNSLKHLYLDHNQVTGTIPESFASISYGRIYVLTLNDNKLTGGAPTEWVKDNRFLITLTVQKNNLTIPIDKDICKFSALQNGELVELGAECNLCTCDTLCEKCY